VRIVFLSMTKMPSTVNPIGSPYSLLRNTFTYSEPHTYTHIKYKKLIIRWEFPNVTWRMSSYLFTYLRLSTDSHDTPTAAYSLFAPTTHPMDHTQVNSTVDIWTWTWLRKIYTVHWCADCRSLLAPICHLPCNVISATVGLVYINLQHEYS